MLSFHVGIAVIQGRISGNVLCAAVTLLDFSLEQTEIKYPKVDTQIFIVSPQIANFLGYLGYLVRNSP